MWLQLIRSHLSGCKESGLFWCRTGLRSPLVWCRFFQQEREQEAATFCQTFLWQCHTPGKGFTCTGWASQVVKNATILTHSRAATLTFVLCLAVKGQGYCEPLNTRKMVLCCGTPLWCDLWYLNFPTRVINSLLIKMIATFLLPLCYLLAVQTAQVWPNVCSDNENEFITLSYPKIEGQWQSAGTC